MVRILISQSGSSCSLRNGNHTSFSDWIFKYELVLLSRFSILGGGIKLHIHIIAYTDRENILSHTHTHTHTHVIYPTDITIDIRKRSSFIYNIVTLFKYTHTNAPTLGIHVDTRFVSHLKSFPKYVSSVVWMLIVCVCVWSFSMMLY